jgi:MscS family membrane protein
MRLWLVTLLLIWPVLVLAQAEPKEASMRDLIEAETKLEKVVEERASEGAIDDMSTPMSSLLLLKDALETKDYVRASEFLDMRYLPTELEGVESVQLLQQLRYVWNRQEILNIAAVSDEPDGHQDDELPGYRDQVGQIELAAGSVPIYMQRVPDGKGGRVWKFSNATVARIPEMWEELGYNAAAEYFSGTLPEFRFMGMENWQVLFLVAALLLGWPLASVICIVLAKIIVRRRGPFQDAIAKFLKFQFRIFLFIVLVRFAILEVGLSLRAVILLQSTGVIYVAVIILLLGVINLTHGYQTRRLIQADNQAYVALLRPIATVAKALVFITVFLVWADDAGYDMSTVIAGLGVGSLAVALAAQKTLENVIGAITIYTARPIKPGDFCRFGTTVGTVEEIGLRSTMIRTLSRTMVSIPNAVFAADEVENFSERDRIRYFRSLRLQIGTAEDMRAVLDALRNLFESHQQVQADTVSVRFDEITDNTAHIRVDAGISTTDFQDYLAIAEQLNLALIDTVQSAGGRFSAPGQHLTVRPWDDMQTILES